MLQTNATAIGDVLVDSPYFPDELAELPPCRVLVATHSHWDHLLARSRFAHAPLLVARETAAEVGAETLADLRRFDAEHYVERDAPPRLDELTVVDVPGEAEGLELIPAPGHARDGMAVWCEAERTLCPGDYLSPVEIPLVSQPGSPSAYRATLERLAPYVERARLVVPGHGRPLDRDAALRLLEQDVAYLEPPLGPVPEGRDTHRQRAIHRDNLRKHAAGWLPARPGAAPPPRASG